MRAGNEPGATVRPRLRGLLPVSATRSRARPQPRRERIANHVTCRHRTAQLGRFRTSGLARPARTEHRRRRRARTDAARRPPLPLCERDPRKHHRHPLRQRTARRRGRVRTIAKPAAPARVAAVESKAARPLLRLLGLASITESFVAASPAPTPLYATYQAAWGFSPSSCVGRTVRVE
jgi:hypothetical protein